MSGSEDDCVFWCGLELLNKFVYLLDGLWALLWCDEVFDDGVSFLFDLLCDDIFGEGLHVIYISEKFSCNLNGKFIGHQKC